MTAVLLVREPAPRATSLEGLDVSDPEHVPEPVTVRTWGGTRGMELDFDDAAERPFTGGYRNAPPEIEGRVARCSWCCGPCRACSPGLHVPLDFDDATAGQTPVAFVGGYRDNARVVLAPPRPLWARIWSFIRGSL